MSCMDYFCDAFMVLFCPFWSSTVFGPHPLLLYRKQQHAHSSKWLLLGYTEERNSCRFWITWRWVNDVRIFFLRWTIPLIGCLKVQLKCVCVCGRIWRYKVSVCLELCMVWACVFCMCVCVCVNGVLVFLYFESSSCHDVRETERESQTSKLAKQDTLHTPISQYTDRTMWALCVSVCVRLCVCVFCMSVVGPIVVYFWLLWR